MTEPLERELGLRDYLQIVRRRKSIVVGTVLLVAVPTLVLALLQTPLYAGRAEMLLRARNSESLFDPASGTPRDPVR